MWFAFHFIIHFVSMEFVERLISYVFFFIDEIAIKRAIWKICSNALSGKNIWRCCKSESLSCEMIIHKSVDCALRRMRWQQHLINDERCSTFTLYKTRPCASSSSSLLKFWRRNDTTCLKSTHRTNLIIRRSSNFGLFTHFIYLYLFHRLLFRHTFGVYFLIIKTSH